MVLTHELVLRIVASNPGITIHKIARHPSVGRISMHTISKIRDSLVRSDYIIVIGLGKRKSRKGVFPHRYEITDEGKVRLQKIDKLRRLAGEYEMNVV